MRISDWSSDVCSSDLAAADIDGVVPGLHLAVETAMHAVIAEQMRIGLDRAEIVDADHFDVGAAAFDNGTQHIAADAAETVNRNANRHDFFSNGKPWREAWRRAQIGRAHV